MSKAEGVVGVGSGNGIVTIAGRRMSLRGGDTAEEMGSSDDSGSDAADTRLVSVTDPVCQLTDPSMIDENTKTDTKTVLFSKLRSAPLSYPFPRVRAIDMFSPKKHPQDWCLIVVTLPSIFLVLSNASNINRLCLACVRSQLEMANVGIL